MVLCFGTEPQARCFCCVCVFVCLLCVCRSVCVGVAAPGALAAAAGSPQKGAGRFDGIAAAAFICCQRGECTAKLVAPRGRERRRTQVNTLAIRLLYARGLIPIGQSFKMWKIRLNREKTKKKQQRIRVKLAYLVRQEAEILNIYQSLHFSYGFIRSLLL